MVRHMADELQCCEMSPTKDNQEKSEPQTNSYHIKLTPLQQVDHHPYLGVELSSDLTWKNHIGIATSKAQITCEDIYITVAAR